MRGEDTQRGTAAGTGRRVLAGRTGVAVAVAVAVVAAVAVLVISAASHPGRPGADRRAGLAVRRLGPPVPLHVRSLSPARGARRVGGDSAVRVAFSAPLAGGQAMPALTPPVRGNWAIDGATLRFTPAVPLPPSTKFTLRVPAGLRSVNGGRLATAVIERFRTAAYSQLRLAEVLSQLGYLPLSWQPNASGRAAGDAFGGTVAAQRDLAYSPPAGTFSWDSGYPRLLHEQWRAGRPSLVLRGAVMAFQAEHHLAITGLTTPRFWHALFAAAASGQRNTVGYTYAIASKGSPETLTIWHDGRRVLRSLANTGIPVSPTVSGTFPVYLRYRFQIMSGTNPDGSHYADPVSFVAYFNAGDAVHYFARGSYGWPQSLGCVELPYDQARRAWPFLTYGSLVTVTG